MTAKAVVGAIVLLLTLSSMGITTSALGGEFNYTIADGEILTANLLADNIILPAGRTAYYSGQIELKANNSIEIAGLLRGYESDGGDIALWSLKDISLSGIVRAASGQHGSDLVSNDSLSGNPGQDGGDISVQWGVLGSFTLANGGRIQTGSGGDGGNAYVLTDSNSPAVITSVGGAGGNPGRFDFTGTLAYIHGTVRAGGLGNGGNAFIGIRSEQTTVAGSVWNATGGAPAPLYIPQAATAWCGMTCVFDVLEEGGGGGSACGVAGEFTFTPTPNLDQQVNYVCRFESPDLPGFPGGLGVPGLPPVNAPGVDGSDGTDVTVTGDDASSAWEDGGDATAYGGNGHTGGGHINCLTPPGRGGDGGDATARGGDGWGGWGPGSNGGNAEAYGGDGGRGGAGCLRGGHGGPGGAGRAFGGDGGDDPVLPGNGGSAYGEGGSGGAGGGSTAVGGVDGDEGSSGPSGSTPGVNGQG